MRSVGYPPEERFENCVELKRAVHEEVSPIGAQAQALCRVDKPGAQLQVTTRGEQNGMVRFSSVMRASIDPSAVAAAKAAVPT
ncbi:MULTISPECIES: hypothetical protein [Streptomyces]|uniref:hypothetical protein n=1 Tax=Streptomyces TaxID=1883 RepID=UPI0034365CA8